MSLVATLWWLQKNFNMLSIHTLCNKSLNSSNIHWRIKNHRWWKLSHWCRNVTPLNLLLFLLQPIKILLLAAVKNAMLVSTTRMGRSSKAIDSMRRVGKGEKCGMKHDIKVSIWSLWRQWVQEVLTLYTSNAMTHHGWRWFCCEHVHFIPTDCRDAWVQAALAKLSSERGHWSGGLVSGHFGYVAA